MAFKLQETNVKKGSYRSYTSFLKQYSSPPKSTNAPSTTINTNEPLVQAKPSPLPKAEKVVKDSNNLAMDNATIETLLAMTSGQIELLNIDVLKQFLDVLTKETQPNYDVKEQVDANNNDTKEAPALDIDQSKHNLIQSLKAQLERYRRD